MKFQFVGIDVSTGTGIFLAGLAIALVMLYGHTKDRWNWHQLAKKFAIGIAILIYIPFWFMHQESNNWQSFDIDWSLKNIGLNVATFFAIGTIAIIPSLVQQFIYKKIIEQDYEFDEQWNERLSHKLATWAFFVLFYASLIFYFQEIKDSISIYFASRI